MLQALGCSSFRVQEFSLYWVLRFLFWVFAGLEGAVASFPFR